ncbi:MAG: serine/threonine protein kinase [Planctomycetota bacterium]|nr:MAG: serine/threonine protein kinase [Planctomycetota bacterium]
MTRWNGLVGALAIFVLMAAARAEEGNWPAFRGPQARGVSATGGMADHWSVTENVAWKTDLPGRGWSSPVVWGTRVFVTTVESTGPIEEAKKGLYFGGDRAAPAEMQHRWKVLCLDLTSGALLWEKTVHEGMPAQPIHIKGSYASETPIADGERLWCLFGNVGLFCFDHDGNQLWDRPLPARAMRNGWGTASSPVLHDGRLYLVNDNQDESEIVALEAASGREVWRVARDEGSNWATPYVWVTPTRTEIVTPGTGQVRSYGTAGELLWTLRGMSAITIATPYEHDGLLCVSSGYVLDKSKPLYAIRPGASGDISLAAGETSNASIAWCQPTAAPYNPTTLSVDGRLFVLHDRGFLAAYAGSDGRELFGPQRIPEGRAFTASPWAADGKIFCLNEDGVTSVFRAGDSFEPLHTNTLAEDDMCMATPALAGERLLIRTAARLYCICQPKTVSATGKPPGIPRVKPEIGLVGPARRERVYFD